jgi:hypothetical protein
METYLQTALRAHRGGREREESCACVERHRRPCKGKRTRVDKQRNAQSTVHIRMYVRMYVYKYTYKHTERYFVHTYFILIRILYLYVYFIYTNIYTYVAIYCSFPKSTCDGPLLTLKGNLAGPLFKERFSSLHPSHGHIHW